MLLQETQQGQLADYNSLSALKTTRHSCPPNENFH